MGVNGLWTVVQPCARPTNLATLNRKRLAVDASIWIYQFLKAVRDKEGNALRNSHVVGFFRRICKLLWFGIQPIFVFDGGAPALKRATIQKRQRRREGRRDDAVRTAGKLLAVQMQRVAEEEEQKRKRERERPRAAKEAEEEPVPDPKDMIYVEEIGMSNQERQRNRKFHKKDAYHLPELDGGIASMGKADDPRIMSVEELEEYARQFNNGEDINLYDFSKIDFDGEFFKSLPAPDRYNILNAARLRSRLRLGLSKEQLDEMFPDRMAFSRFQIERVQERNHLTQRLMYEVGMTGLDLTLPVNARVAGEKDREYILVKNDGAEGGWALGVVSKEKDSGEAHKPIDVDAIDVQYQTKEEEDEEDDVDGFEDVPIEGLNRLPKSDPTAATLEAALDIASRRRQFYGIHKERPNNEEDSLFVGGPADAPAIENEVQEAERIHPEEEDDLNRAIALSLQNQHVVGEDSATDDELFEDVPIGDKPKWTQKAVEAAKPLTTHSGSMIAHIVNNRSNAAVTKRQEKPETQDSDSDEDMQAIMARSRQAKKQAAPPPRPVPENTKNPFDGPLPFPKLSWGSSLFGTSKMGDTSAKNTARGSAAAADVEENGAHDDMAGGFTVEGQDDQTLQLPPWLADVSDIRDSLKKQQDAEREINAQDREDAEEVGRRRMKEMQDRLIEIDSDSDNDSDIQIIEVPPSPALELAVEEPQTDSIQTEAEQLELEHQAERSTQLQSALAESQLSDAPGVTLATTPPKDAESPEPELEDIELPQASEELVVPELESAGDAVSIHEQNATTVVNIDDDELFGDAEEDEYSDPEEEELLVQMAEEAEEHARFATELNQKSMEQNRRDYEQELRQLRTQQKKDRRDADEVTQVMVSECQSLLRLFGIPYITAPMEAEAQCAELVRLGMVDGIVTDDSDTFLFGGTRVYKNMFNSNKFVECYIGSELEKDLSLSRQQLISLAHLLGSDYTEGLPGVGPVTAVEILSEFPGRDGLGHFRAWWDADASSPFRKKFRRAQAAKLFLPPGFPNHAVDDAYLHPVVDGSTEPFQWGVPDVEGLRRFLMATIGWSKERTDEVLVPVIRDMNKREVEGTQSNITRFFGGGVGAGARGGEAFAPRQTAGTSKRMAAAVDKLRKNTAGGGEEASQQTNKRQKRELEMRIKALTKSVAANEAPENALRLLDLLKKDAAPTEEMLRATRAGVFVGKLRSNANKEIARSAAELVNKWKKLVEQEKYTKMQKSKLGSPASGTAASPPTTTTSATATPAGANKKFAGDPETRKYDADGVDTKRTDSTVRNSCIGLIYNGLAFRSTASESDVLAKAVAVEAAAFAHFKGEGADYKKKIRSLFTNLKNKSNRALGVSVMGSEIPPERFVAMTDDDLKSDDQRKKEIELEKENMKKAQVPMAEKSISDSLECGKCKQKKVSYTQAQTRSADEPMTTFCECMNCGNRWKFS
ncbi:DNA excision repair Rad2 [Cordyceps militaris]|uniref:DNA excision repair Rad2 n=1 Tax=Cordyceps militaris TaxID=73501 RepID=A0A2H4S6Q1_CORMI|nr:DNA excision repair Rad2 [Cordyceps militaris]